VNTTRRTLALVASVLAGSGLVLIGQQSAQADVASTPCVTTTIAPAALLDTSATGTSDGASTSASAQDATSAGADATADAIAAAVPEACAPSAAAPSASASTDATSDATSDDAGDNPLCDLLGHRACVDLPTEIPDPPTDPEPTDEPTSSLPTDDPSSTTTQPTSTTTGPVVTDPGQGGNNGGGNNGGGNGGNNGAGNNGGSVPTGTLGTGPVAVEGNVGDRDSCGALQCANQDYADLVAPRTQQNAAVPSAAAVAGPAGPALARTGSPISSLTTYAGGLLVVGALLLGTRRRLVPGYARRH
jgi:hypothetical protein